MFFQTYTKWMAPYRMFFHMYYVFGPIQNMFPNILNGWPHTECFSIRITWMAPYRMIIHTFYMDGPIQNVFPYVLHGWPDTEC